MICYRGYWYSWCINLNVPFVNVFIRKGNHQWSFTIQGSYGMLTYEMIGAMACSYIDYLFKRQ